MVELCTKDINIYIRLINMRFQNSVVYFSKAIPLLLLFWQYSSLCFGQNEAINWPLGPVAGLTFQSGSGEKLAPNDIAANVVTAVISDVNGNLLFYTDGTSVWDKRNNIMPNGSDIAGMPYSPKVQICPKPGDPSRYFIFTTKSTNWGAPNDFARFSEVDLCLNGGLGDVVNSTKNTPLTSALTARGAIVKHANGVDYWVAFHLWQSDQIHCFKVTRNGIDPKPIISSVGTYLGYSSYSTGDGGEMKFSSNGKRMGMVILQYASAEIFDFDSQTGIFSNAITIPAMYRQNFLTPDYTLGLEFSPDSHKLYITRITACLLTQYDLNAGDQNAIAKSRVILAGDTLQHSKYDFYILYGLQLGPDGKIYAAWVDEYFSGVSVISSPNEPGLNSNYEHNILNWENNIIEPNYFLYFPNFAASFFNSSPIIQNDFTCTTASVNFQLNFNYGDKSQDIDHLVWNFDDPTSGLLNMSLEPDPAHTFVTGGEHRISCIITWKDNTTTTLGQIINIPELILLEDLDILPADTILCAGTPLMLDASKLGNVRWQDGSLNSHFNVSDSGKFWFSTCLSGCIISDTVKVFYEELHDVLGADTILCEQMATLELGSATFPIIEWQDKTTNPTYTVTKQGNYWAAFQTEHCILKDTIRVDYCEHAVFIPNVITPNGDLDNENFELMGIDNENCRVWIYGRDGVLLYESRSYQNDWNGEGISSGVYYYYILHSGTDRFYKGWLQILR